MSQTLLDWFNGLVQQIDTPALAPVVLLVGMALLIVGGRWLVNGSVTLARSLGISTLIVGLTVVAFGTSSPELAFNVVAALNDNTGLSFGNVVGSNIANIGFVLGLSALTAPLVIHRRVVGKELPWLILISLGTIALALLPPYIQQGDDELYGFSRVDGGILLLVFASFLLTWYRMARRDAKATLLPTDEAALDADPPKSIGVACVLVILGLALLAAGGKAAEIGAVRLAISFNVNKEVVGLTIVAIATSLPEAIASITACRAGHTDLAVGNVIGSNIFNLLLVLGTTCTVEPVPIPETLAWFDLALMTGLTLAILPLALWRGLAIRRVDGGLLLLCYVVYLSFRVYAALT